MNRAERRRYEKLERRYVKKLTSREREALEAEFEKLKTQGVSPFVRTKGTK